MRPSGSLLLTLLLAAGIAVAGIETPITLDVQDGDSGELLRALAALANLDLVTDPGLEARLSEPVTLRLENATLPRAIAAVSRATGLALRIEGSRLVASLPARASSAPPLPEEFRDEPRIPLPRALAEKLDDRKGTSWSSLSDEVAAQSRPPAVHVRIEEAGIAGCYAPALGRADPPAFALLLPGAPPEKLLVVPVAYDPVRRARYLAMETARAGDGTLVRVEPGRETTWRTSGGSVVALSADAEESCTELRLAAWPAADPTPSFARVEVTVRREGTTAQLFGTCLVGETGRLAAYRGIHDPGKGQFRDDRLYGYVWRDGRKTALVLALAAVWTAPRSGERVYVTQFAHSPGFVALAGGGVTALEMMRGPAAPGPVQLRVFAEKDRWVCATPREGPAPVSPAR